MALPFKINDDDYVRMMYDYETKGIGIYRHLEPTRILNARWIYFNNLIWVSDFGGLGMITLGKPKPVFPHIAIWHKGKDKALIHNRHSGNVNINVYVPSVVYKLYNGFPDNEILTKSDIEFEFYNGLFWDCRVENISLKKDEGYGVGIDFLD